VEQDAAIPFERLRSPSREQFREMTPSRVKDLSSNSSLGTPGNPAQIIAEMKEYSTKQSVQVTGLRLLQLCDIDLSILRVVLGAMERFPRCMEIQRYGALLLSSLSSISENNCEEIVKMRGLKQAIEALSSRTFDVDSSPEALSGMHVACFQCVSRIARVDKESCRDSIAPILNSLSQGTSEVVIHGSWSLMNICCKNGENQLLFRRLGGLGLLVELLKKWKLKAHGIACAYVAGCLATVCEGKKNQVALNDHDGLAALIDVLDIAHRDHPQIASNVCIAVAHTVYKEPGNQTVAGEAMMKILDVLTYEDVGARSNACRAIASLTENHSVNKERVLDADGMKMLFEVLNTTESSLATTGCWALVSLCKGNPRAMERGFPYCSQLVSCMRRFDARFGDYARKLIMELTGGRSEAALRNWDKFRELGLV